MVTKGHITKNIEILRDKLCHYLLYLSPTDSKVIYISQELDKYLVLYEKSKLQERDSA